MSAWVMTHPSKPQPINQKEGGADTVIIDSREKAL